MLLPELENRTVKMYRGAKICLSSHFKPLWAKNAPHFGIAHALAMGVSSHAPHRIRAALPL
jgi:ufm1-conjugating enzyme 1